LLVRLQTNSKQKEIINKYASEKKKKELEEKLSINNEDLIDGFTEFFDFCDVYFFNSDDAREVAKGNFSKVFSADGGSFYDDDFSGDFLIAGIGNRQYDTYYTREYLSIVITDTLFTQLEKPTQKKKGLFQLMQNNPF